MALHFEMRVNGTLIGEFVATRKTGTYFPPDPDDVNEYHVDISSHNVGNFKVDQLKVEHRYGDGAWELVRKALEAKRDA